MTKLNELFLTNVKRLVVVKEYTILHNVELLPNSVYYTTYFLVISSIFEKFIL
jgi:hypothetical protein